MPPEDDNVLTFPSKHPSVQAVIDVLQRDASKIQSLVVCGTIDGEHFFNWSQQTKADLSFNALCLMNMVSTSLNRS